MKNNYKKGKLNLISDVPGVRVGHKTISSADIQTGVTIISPSYRNIYKNKLAAASYVINGFGKTTGLMQIDELGTLESYIGLTNTLSVGTVQQTLVKRLLKENSEIGITSGTVNVVVGECNDGYLNDIRACIVSEDDVNEALENLKIDFKLGSVGAGVGMSCFEMKGGIGSSSRVIEFDNQEYTIGSLVLSNFGLKKDFILDELSFEDIGDNTLEQGSVIIVLATNIPLDARQLKRVCKRATVSLSRVGSYLGNGSGDIVIAFSTANVTLYKNEDDFTTYQVLNEDKIDEVFRASIEASQEAIMSSLVNATTIKGKDNHIRYSLKETIKQMKK